MIIENKHKSCQEEIFIDDDNKSICIHLIRFYERLGFKPYPNIKK